MQNKQRDQQPIPLRIAGDTLECLPLMMLALRERPDSVYGADETGANLTFANLGQRIAQFQAWLAREGVRQGDNVAVMVGNGIDHVALVLALILSRVVWVPVNTKLKEQGVKHILRVAAPHLLVLDDDMDIGAARGTCRTCAMPGVLPAGSEPVAAAGSPGDTLALIFTSGTTGAAKAVDFTHRMLRVATEAVVIVAAVRDGDRMLLWEPLCHIGGAQLLVLPFMLRVELFVTRRFSATTFWGAMQATRATHIHYLGGILDILAKQAAPPPLPELRVIWGAGASEAAWTFAREKLGIVLRECYGMTECSSFATVNGNGTPLSMGSGLPWLQVELRAADDTLVAEGQTGEVVLTSCLSGAFTRGYMHNPEATARAVRGERLYTGDLARQDAEGNYYFAGRGSDSMRVRGENVSAWEVEQIFATHPSIAENAAVGVASPLGEQDILLFVRTRDGAAPDFAAMHRWAQERLARFQLPRFYLAVSEFPHTPSERIRKQLLPRETEGAWDSELQRIAVQ